MKGMEAFKLLNIQFCFAFVAMATYISNDLILELEFWNILELEFWNILELEFDINNRG